MLYHFLILQIFIKDYKLFYLFMKHVRSIVVTGSNKGIGLGIARHFAKCSNWNVIMAIRNI